MSILFQHRSKREVSEQIAEHYRAGIRKIDDLRIVYALPKLQHLVETVVFTILDDWLPDTDAAITLRSKHFTLAQIVAMAVENASSVNFSLQMAATICDHASGTPRLDIDSLRRNLKSRHGAARYIWSEFPNEPDVRSPKRLIQEMAKAILWLETITFFEAHGDDKVFEGVGARQRQA